MPKLYIRFVRQASCPARLREEPTKNTHGYHSLTVDSLLGALENQGVRPSLHTQHSSFHNSDYVVQNRSITPRDGFARGSPSGIDGRFATCMRDICARAGFRERTVRIIAELYVRSDVGESVLMMMARAKICDSAPGQLWRNRGQICSNIVSSLTNLG